MNWKVKALLQKILATNRIGDRINHLNASLKKEYHSSSTEYGFKQLFEKIDAAKASGSLLKNVIQKDVLEFGTGYSLVQPVILKLLGWGSIMTVDITYDLFYETVKKQLGFLFQNKYLSEIRHLSELNPNVFDDLVEKINAAESLTQIMKMCNIVYIAPYEFEDISKKGIKFDFIFSQVVLEHIPPDVLKKLFFNTKKWLKEDGCIVHIVNFIDHFTNPGFFGDQNISEFNFLQYSEKHWNFWAGNSIAYTNRLGYPYYYQLCEESGLRVVKFIEQNYKERKPLGTDKIHQDVISKYNKNVDLNEVMKCQRGIFVITHK